MSHARWVWVVTVILAGNVAEARLAHKSTSPLDDVSVSTLVHEAERLYSVGRFKDAALLLEKAQSREPNPIFIYNIARAWEQQGEMERALEFYQRYLATPDDTEPSLVRKAALSVDRIKAQHSKMEQERRAQDGGEKAERSKLLAEQDARTQRALQDIEARKRAEAVEQANSHSPLLSFIAGGVAGAGLGVGAGFFFASLSSEANDQQNLARTQRIISGVSAGVGVGALVTSILLYPRTPPRKEEAQASAKLKLNLLLSPVSAGASVRF